MDMPNPERFGPFVRRYRLAKAINLRDFALATGLEAGRIAYLERHATTKPPLAYEVKAIAYALGLDPVALQRIADDYAPDMEAVEADRDPLKNATFACRTEE
jgi:transcriptional regulator with XRE-family HTH domain